MSIQAFVDESQRKRYMICTAIISPNVMKEVRDELRKLLLPQQRRLHFVNESPQRRRRCLAIMAELPVRARMYTSQQNEAVARELLLGHLLSDLLPLKCQRLIIESRETNQNTRERSQIAAAIRKGVAPQMTYEHMRPHEEPLLWIPDAIAWAYGAGREWRSNVDALLSHVLEV